MSEQALIFNIQKFSIHDGPGIRTTVFVKGCPLRCRWCANPESQLSRAQVRYDRALCLRCGQCARACPTGAAQLTEVGVRINATICTGCGQCVQRCDAHALTLDGQPTTVAEVVRICMQDAPFYEESGGGVTISGGEPLSQPDFTLALLRALQEAGVHTALETTGHASSAVFDRVTAAADLLLFDVKHPDSQRHLWGTGVPNDQIIANLSRAIASGKAVLPRIPVIPGFNDSLETAHAFAQLLRRVGATRAQLLPFHQLGEKKYDMLGMDYSLRGVRPLHEEDLTPFRDALRADGIDAFF